MNKRWRPSVTVAAVIEHEGRFLLVEEHTPEGLRLNNPAGHLEPGETPQAAVVREALEETGREFVPEALLGVYLARFVRARPPRAAPPGRPHRGEAEGGPRPPEDITYLRLAYSGRVGDPLPGLALDPAIVRTLWLTRDEIAAEAARLRSPLVMRCIDDHLAGRRLPLDAVFGDESLAAPVPLQPLARAGEPADGEAAPGGPPAVSRSARRRARKRMQGMQEHDTEAASAPDRPDAGMPAGGAPGAQADALAEPGLRAPRAAATPVTLEGDGQAAPQAVQAGPASPASQEAVQEAAQAAADAAPDAAAASAKPAQQAAARAEPTWAETAAALAERFPALFSPGQPRPIKLRIQADIQARTQGAFTRKQLSIFLHRHTTSTPYLRALVASPQRFDLDGQPAGDVAVEHVEAAKEELERRRQIVQQRRAQQGPRPGRPSSAGRAPAGAAETPAEAPAVDAVAAGERPSRPPRPARPEAGGRPDRPVRLDRRDRPGTSERGPRPAAAGPRDRPPRGDAGARPGASGAPGGRPARPERGERGQDRSHDRGLDRGSPRRGDGDRAEATIALPHDPEHRERAMLLRSFEGSPLTAANYCALKGLVLAEFEAQIALARREREKRQRAGVGGT